MTEILTDLSFDAVTNANIANLYAYFGTMKQVSHANFYQNDMLCRWNTKLKMAWFNGVLCSQLPDENAAAVVAEQIAHFQSCNVSAFYWWLTPEIPLSSWEPVLSARGFVHDTDLLFGLDLDQPIRVPATPPGLRITTVTDTETLWLASQTFTRGFELTPDWDDELYDLQLGQGIDWPFHVYLAWLDGAPVAASVLYLAEGVASIIRLATVPEARRKGLGAAVTAAALREARTLGYRVATLQASRMGATLYRNMGFKYEATTEHFYWSPKTGGI